MDPTDVAGDPHMPDAGMAPTSGQVARGRDPESGLSWAFEAPDVHWTQHDARQVSYWRSRPPAERLAQAAWYRRRLWHDSTPSGTTMTWTWVPPVWR